MEDSNTTRSITFADRATRALGSNASLVLHTLIFAACFVAIFMGANAERVLLLLTTVVSLEAIYLSLFIQISVNRNTSDIANIQDDIEDIAEDVEDIAEDVEGIEKDIEEIQEDVEHIEKEIEEIADDVEEIQEDVEGIEKDIDEIAEDMEGIEKDIEEIAEDVEDIADEHEEDDSDSAIHQVNINPASESNNKLLIELLQEIKTLRTELNDLKK